jgi:IS605 OrfB family transposase
MPQPAPPNRPATAIDVGLEYFATFSDGSHIDNPRYLREVEEVLARRQRQLQTKKRGSKNRCRAKLLVAKAHRKMRNKRQNFHHEEARKIVDAHGAIAIEGLRIKNMVRNPNLAKSISDAGWNQFLTILTHKAEEAGVVVVVVNPAGTSQVCSGCGRSVPKELSDRWHICPYEECGLSLQRDHNSARAILHRAGLARAVAYVPAAESRWLRTSGHGECQRASQPPSTARTWPWTHAAAGLHRKTTAPATSSGRPQRPAGMRTLICSLRTGSAMSGAVWSVAM